jgi:hypothetical protein
MVLKNGRYAKFKKSILNGMMAGLVTQPTKLNEMYFLANQLLKTMGPTQSGLASIFVTKPDMPDIGKPGKNKNNRQWPEKEKEEPEKPKSKEDLPKLKRDMSKVKCFNCGEKGHIATNYPNADEAASYVIYQVFNTV